MVLMSRGSSSGQIVSEVQEKRTGDSAVSQKVVRTGGEPYQPLCLTLDRRCSHARLMYSLEV